jgi:hypothetical protein
MVMLLTDFASRLGRLSSMEEDSVRYLYTACILLFYPTLFAIFLSSFVCYVSGGCPLLSLWYSCCLAPPAACCFLGSIQYRYVILVSSLWLEILRVSPQQPSPQIVAAVMSRPTTPVPDNKQQSMSTSIQTPWTQPGAQSSTSAGPLEQDSKSTEEKVRDKQHQKRMEQLTKLRMQLQDSNKFSGDRGDRGDGALTIRQWMDMVADTLAPVTQEDWERCYVVKGWLKGTAQRTVLAEESRRKEAGEAALTWSEMQKMLTQMFDIGNHSDRAIQHLSSISMTSNPTLSSVTLYNADWRKWLPYIPTAEWDTTAMTVLYERGLKPRIREKLIECKHAARLWSSSFSASQTPVPPRARLIDLMDMAIEVESMIKDVNVTRGPFGTGSDSRGGASGSASNRSASAVSVNVVETADEQEDCQPGTEEEIAAPSVNAVSAQQTVSTSAASKAAIPSSTKRNVLVSQQDRIRLMKEGRCFNCYQKGHTQQKCTQQQALKKPVWPLK